MFKDLKGKMVLVNHSESQQEYWNYERQTNEVLQLKSKMCEITKNFCMGSITDWRWQRNGWVNLPTDSQKLLIESAHNKQF